MAYHDSSLEEQVGSLSPEDERPESGSQHEHADDGGRTVVRIPRRRAGAGAQAEPELHEKVRGAHPGDRTIRLTRPGQQKLRRLGEGAFEATRAVLRPSTGLGRLWSGVRHVVIGQPMATADLPHQRLSKIKALAVYSSDNLSSSAYATEEILIILIAAGTGALTRSIPITLALVALTAIVVTSYRQTIRAYPNGGGAYIVATDNFGLVPGLVAGSSLLVDYILTVSVSIAAGVAAVTSAAPGLLEVRIELAVGFVLLITLANLRGIRESGTIFAIPTYFFIFSFGGMLVVGLVAPGVRRGPCSRRSQDTRWSPASRR